MTRLEWTCRAVIAALGVVAVWMTVTLPVRAMPSARAFMLRTGPVCPVPAVPVSIAIAERFQ